MGAGKTGSCTEGGRCAARWPRPGEPSRGTVERFGVDSEASEVRPDVGGGLLNLLGLGFLVREVEASGGVSTLSNHALRALSTVQVPQRGSVHVSGLLLFLDL